MINPQLTFDPRAFRGLMLQMVGVLSNQLHLSFDGGTASIDVFGGYEVAIGSRVADHLPPADSAAPPRYDAILNEVLDQAVVGADLSADGQLILIFDGGAQLTVENTHAFYESYRVTLDGAEFVV